jgi:hypothetical protein
MPARRLLLLTVCFASLLSASLSAAASAADPALAARIARVESGLLPPARLTGTPLPTWTISSRLAAYQVPGLSLAVIADGQLSWARAYGRATTTTTFPAAEIGEALVAATLLSLVDAGRLALDTPVASAPAAAAGESPVTLRHLLSHTAGLALTTPPRVEIPPGTRWRHSPVGFTLARDLATTTAGEPFPALARTRVLAPAGLASSSFDNTGALTTIPIDLATFALALRAALDGQPSVLALASATAMITPPLAGSDFGLGLGVSGTGDALRLAHTGSADAARCAFVFYPRTGRGAVIMADSDSAGPLIAELLRSLSREYGWPDYRVVEKTAIPLSVSAVSAFSGRYEREDTPVLVFRLNDRFYIRIGDRPRFEIFPQSDHEFFTLDSPDLWSFERGPTGVASHIVLRSSPPQLYRRLNPAPINPVRVAPPPPVTRKPAPFEK